MRDNIFFGTIPALITPFSGRGNNSEIDFKTLESLIEWHLSSGVNGFVVGGTTAEVATLSATEKMELFKRTKEIVNKRVPLLAGTGSNCTRSTIELTQKVKSLGYEGALVVSPYYNKPTQEGLFQHLSAVATEGGLPVVLYNIPGRVVIEITNETFSRLVKVPGIIGIKEASNSASKIMDLIEIAADKVAVYAGDCNLTYLVMAAGGQGTISASANVIPQEMVQITEAARRKDWESARQAQLKVLPIIRALFAETNPAPAKAALKLLGKIPDDSVRLPLVGVREETIKLIEKSLFSHSQISD
jgi:4-hydroxy-tetrahydrodipicolinate synthase